ncbi:MAG: hypothetical protein ABIP02_10005, partial [Arenimonas sp.]
ADKPDTGIETLLHASCVKAGAAAALQIAVERLPLLKPFLPAPISRAARGDAPERIQRLMVKEIYSRYRLKPAGWEIEGILAVAQTQSVLTPLATQEGLYAVLKAWLPKPFVIPLMRYTPLEPLVVACSKAIAATWAAGRYADSVCRLRKAGADWLPAPLAEALQMAPSTLKSWSAEALSLALPPLKFATLWGKRAAVAALNAAPKAVESVKQTKPKVVKKVAVKKVSAKKVGSTKKLVRKT